MFGRCGTAQRRWCCPRRPPERGAVAVEFALVLPLLVMLLVGTVTTGLSYTHALGVTNAVREGARFGATADAAAPAPANWTTDVIARVRATQFDDLAATPETAICVGLYRGSTFIKGGCDQGDGSVSPALAMPVVTAYPSLTGLPATACAVRVIAARNFTINAVIIPPIDKTMVRGAVARYEREAC